ncbi:GreA/GreB family elongation factor [Leifsonia sp. F6_8S_P_1B]|uniref:GreA/GreB family elongation factor n=1 Tax=Leifsonia williamsii TaxID=3035919 RepID=A0ABT8K7E7_9MICO|nr:GreA/GreB family elongation factor [Leifsonia williamsii]MDN4613388.1 GreA/GreB family elongation factor [Leifsonia williamsii]
MDTAAHATPVWMTAESRERLQKELDGLKAAPAPTGDAGVTHASRILELVRILRTAEVGSKPDDGLVEPGMKVTVRFDGEQTVQAFLLGSRELLADSGIELDVYSPSSPLGAAINGKYAGDTAEFVSPSGRTVQVAILAAVPFTGV